MTPRTRFDDADDSPINAHDALDPAADTVIRPILSSTPFPLTPNQTDAAA
jgi:hypothetical protein